MSLNNEKIKYLLSFSLIALFITSIYFLSSSFTNIVEGKVIVIEENEAAETKFPQDFINNKLDSNIYEKIISKNKDLLKSLNMQLIPIAVSPDYNTAFAYETQINTEMDIENSMIISGNFKQQIKLYSINTKTYEKKEIGIFTTLKDFQFDDSGNLFAFIDGSNNIFVYNLHNEILNEFSDKGSYSSYNKISWSKNSKRIMADTSAHFDVETTQFISYYVDTPYIKARLDATDYIVQMKSTDTEDIVAVYNFSTGEYASLAKGIYIDSDNRYIIYSNQNMSMLSIVNQKTNESKIIEEGPIYSANILKSTGKVIYTTLNKDINSQYRYELYEYNPVNGAKKSLSITTPTFFLHPAEEVLYFVPSYSTNSIQVDLKSFTSSFKEKHKDNGDIKKIKTTIYKMLHYDYNFNGNYEKYVRFAKEIYTDTYDPVAQEAYSNKLIDFKRFNSPLPNNQKDITIPHTLRINSIDINNDRAAVNIGLFYINALEMVKIGDNWLITGFSTHPYSKEVSQVTNEVNNHLFNILTEKREDALGYCDISKDNEFVQSQIKIIEDLIVKKESYTFEVGEIELWNINQPHRVQASESATDARVKIIIKNESDIIKYKLNLTRLDKNSFKIKSWSTDPLSISQLF